jgi:hypothetical protein
MLDIIGHKFGRLEVKGFVGIQKRHSYWSCVCDCGNIRRVRGSHLTNGNTKSCGCLKEEQIKKANTFHGQSGRSLTTLTYACWARMLQRCNNPKYIGYTNYGGRGIKVCERWHKFENFFEDMGECPRGMTLDRKDNNGDYTPDNCRWATPTEQANNRRSNIWKEYKGEWKTIAQWARSLDIKYGTLYSRLNGYGWSIERALSKGDQYEYVARVKKSD